LSLSPFIFFVAKKEKTGKIGGKEREKEKGGLPRERLTTSNARKDKYERRNMNENDFSAAFDAEDAFASRMDYMRRRRRRRRRRRSRKGRRGESAKAESFRTSTNLLCPRWDPENNTELEVSSGSRFGKILFEVRNVCAERERVSREESRNPETRKAGRVANPEAKRVRGNGMG
jgi:hypothetical protein